MQKLPFSKRGKPQPATLRYEIPPNVRQRILHTLDDMMKRMMSRDGSLYGMFEYAGTLGRQRYGALKSNSNLNNIGHAAFDHFFNCSDEEVIDMLEWAFNSHDYSAQNDGVEAVNSIFREEGIGYEFSPYVAKEVEVPNDGTGLPGGHGYRYEIQYPECTIKSNELLHSTTVMPALQLLSGPTWKSANEEMLKAHEHLRDGNFADAIHWAGKCLESVLKTIIDANTWTRNPKDTLNPLLKECEARGLFDAAYVDVIQHSSGRIRNTYSGHGAGPAPAHTPPTFQMAEHMIQITSSHVVLLAKLAGIA